MTTLKREKTEIENENHHLKNKLDDLYFLNQKLDEALRQANTKIFKYETSQDSKL